MITDEFELIDLTKDGKCTGCGQCCSNYLPMSETDVIRIKKWMSKNKVKEQKHILPTNNLSIDLTCPFLDMSKPDKKCSIYHVRPSICKAFKCNDKEGAMKNKQLYHERYRVVDMRNEFFGRATEVTKILQTVLSREE